MFLPAQLYPLHWAPDLYAIATLLAGLAGISGVIAGWKHSKLWYISGTFGFLTCAVFVAGAAV